MKKCLDFTPQKGMAHISMINVIRSLEKVPKISLKYKKHVTIANQLLTLDEWCGHCKSDM